MSTLYEKRGRRYYPVHDTAAMDGLGNGAWLVVVEDGMRSVVRGVNVLPIMARVAATKNLATIIANAIRTHSRYIEGRDGVSLTPKEIRAYKAYADVMGPGSIACFTRPAARTVADEAARQVMDRVAKENDNA